MEQRSRFKHLLRNLTISPYDWRYTLKLPFYLLRPSFHNPTAMAKAQQHYRSKHSEESAIKLVLAGDIMQLKGDSIPVLSPELIELIDGADYFIANCEAPIVDRPCDKTKNPVWNFAMSKDYLAGILSQLPIANDHCILGVANNHSDDQGAAVFHHGLTLLKQALGVQVVGDSPYLVIQSDKHPRVAITAWTHLMNGGKYLAQQNVVNRYASIAQIDWQQEKQKATIDCLIGLPHWDREYQFFPQASTRQLAKQLMENGFDLLVGSHPHVAQPVELINEKLCCYSMGNFCSQDWQALTKLIPIVTVMLSAKGKLCRYQVDFFVQCHDADGTIHLRPLEALPEKKKMQKIIQRLYQEIENAN